MKRKARKSGQENIPAIIILCTICALVVYAICKNVVESFKRNPFQISMLVLAIVFLFFFIYSLYVNSRMKQVKPDIISFLQYIKYSSDIVKYFENRDKLITILRVVSKGEFLLRKENRLDEKPSVILEKLSFEEDIQVFYTIKRMYEAFRKKAEKSGAVFSRIFSEEIEKCFPRFCQENKEEATECLKKLIAYESTKTDADEIITEENKTGYFLDDIKTQSKKEITSPKELFTVYCYGHLFRIYPVPSWPYSNHIDLICESNIIISEDAQYDLTQKESILSIAIPRYAIHVKSRIDRDLGIASSLEFALRMKGDEYWKVKNYELAIACYEKATELMAVSDEDWKDEDLYLIVRKLDEIGQNNQADRWRIWLNRNYFNFDEEGYIDDIELLRKIDPVVQQEETTEQKPDDMGKLERTDKQLKKQLDIENDRALIVYARGYITKITPEPDGSKGYDDILNRIRAATSIISDGNCYDLTNPHSVCSISIEYYFPQKNNYNLGSWGTVEYLLMEKAFECDPISQRELGIAYLRKAVELMKISDVEWDRRDYQRLVWRFNDFGEKTDASELERWYKSNVLTDEQEADLIIAGKIDKELSCIHKEIITIKRVTTEDMIQFSNIPYQLNCPIKKFIKHGGHPFAYIDLNDFNKKIAIKELQRLDEYIIQARSYIPLLTDEYHIDVNKIMLYNYSESYGYTRLMCTPHTFTGKISKHPLSLFFMSRGDIWTYSVNGELFYYANGSWGKAIVNIWISPDNYSHPGNRWTFEFKEYDGEFILSRAITTLQTDENGMAATVYRCSHIAKEEQAREINRAIFKWLQKHFPEDCPKSISGFSRMKNANSKKYQALVKKVEAAGFVFPETVDDVSKWLENQ